MEPPAPLSRRFPDDCVIDLKQQVEQQDPRVRSTAVQAARSSALARSRPLRSGEGIDVDSGLMFTGPLVRCNRLDR